MEDAGTSTGREGDGEVADMSDRTARRAAWTLFAAAFALWLAAGVFGWLPPIGLTGTFLILLFPDGHLPGRRWRWVAYTSGLGIVAGTLVLLLAPGPMTGDGYPATDNPIGIEALGSFLDVAQFVLILIP